MFCFAQPLPNSVLAEPPLPTDFQTASVLSGSSRYALRKGDMRFAIKPSNPHIVANSSNYQPKSPLNTGRL